MKGQDLQDSSEPVMKCVLKTAELSKRQESELDVAEIKMLRFSLGAGQD